MNESGAVSLTALSDWWRLSSVKAFTLLYAARGRGSAGQKSEWVRFALGHCEYNTAARCEGGAMTKQGARPAPEIHVTDIVLPHQTNNEN